MPQHWTMYSQNIKSKTPVVLSDQEFRRRLIQSALMMTLLPPLVGGSVMGFIGFYPMPEFYSIFLGFPSIYVLTFVIVTLFIANIGYRFFVRLTQLNEDDRKFALQKYVIRFPRYMFGYVTLYSIGGITSANSVLESQGYIQYQFNDYVLSYLGLVPVVMITAFPIYFNFTDNLGRYLGPRGIHMVINPMKTKLFMLGLMTPALVDTVMILYFYNRFNDFTMETFFVWLMLMAIAATGTVLALNSFRQGIMPMEGVLHDSDDDAVMQTLIPQSLDEHGKIVSQLHALFEEKEKSSNALRKERDFYSAVVDNAAALVIVLNKQGRIHRFNHACEKLTGYSAKEALGEFVWDHFLVPEEAALVKSKAFENHVNNPEQIEGDYTNYWVSKSGEKRLIEWKNSLLLDEHGEMEFMVSVGADITQQKADEEKLEKLVEMRTSELKAVQSELLQKERLSTLGELTATISHEIRNPLGAMQTSLYLLKKRSSEHDEKQRRALESIERNINRCDNIIDELLDFTRESKIELDPVDISLYLKKVINEFSFPDGLKIESDIALENIMVNIDSGRLQRVFINVLNNAIESMMNETSKELEKNSLV